jgi:hypothetical protein
VTIYLLLMLRLLGYLVDVDTRSFLPVLRKRMSKSPNICRLTVAPGVVVGYCARKVVRVNGRLIVLPTFDRVIRIISRSSIIKCFFE